MLRNLALTVVLAVSATSAAQVAIRDIGLSGYWAAAPRPTRVRLELTNPSAEARPVQLRLSVVSGNTRLAETLRDYETSMTLAPKTRMLADFPVNLGSAGQRVQVRMLDANGRLLSLAQARVEANDGRRLVAFICRDPDLCQQGQATIQFSGTMEEQVAKGKNLGFLQLDDPAQDWWAYEPVSVLILASPTRALSARQRDAIEGFLRAGGTLVLCEAEMADPDFLSAYRDAPPDKPRLVGKGYLVRVPSVASPDLKHFEGWAKGRAVDGAMGYFPSNVYLGDTERYLRQRLGTSFDFPRLGALVLWLAVYIAVVGPMNFILLRKARRREMGWITVPVLSLLFASALYAWSAAKRPKDVGLDQIGLYFTDDQSAMAYGSALIRVSSPDRERFRVLVSGDAVLYDAGTRPPEQLSDVFDSERQHEPETIRMGAGYEMDISLYRWSFRDLRFETVMRLAGPVRADEKELRNQTGKAFREALYVTPDAVYFLGPMAAGASVALASVRHEPLASVAGRVKSAYPHDFGGYGDGKDTWMDPETAKKELEGLRRNRFSLVELIRGWPKDGGKAFEQRSAIFFGLSDSPMLPADLPDRHLARKQATVTVVSFEARP